MADTIREKVLANIETTLEGITTLAGYINTIASVERWNQGGNSLASLPCIVVNAGPEESEDRPGFITSCRLSVLVDVWAVKDTGTDAYLNALLGDIKKALMADYTRSGYAVVTRIRSVLPFETAEGQPYCGLIINVEVEYRHKTQDPTTSV